MVGTVGSGESVTGGLISAIWGRLAVRSFIFALVGSLSAPEETSAPSKAPGGTEQLYHSSSSRRWSRGVLEFIALGVVLEKKGKFCLERGLPIVEFQEELVSFLSCSVRTTLLSPMLRAHAASSSASSAGNYWRQKEKDRHT